jgi:hypothetical protein
MKTIQILLISLIILLGTICGKSQEFVGLWQIQKVEVGSQEMTPIAKWSRINEDHTHESGNGWYQHSIGTWNYNSENKKIDLVNTNGLKDEFGAFSILISTDQEMIWSRQEGEDTVILSFKRIDKIPQSPSNKLLGVWKLKTEVKESVDPYLFFRWDQILIDQQKVNEKKYAIYKTHGHKQELQIIYYEDPLRQENWNYQFDSNNHLILENNNTKEGKKLEFEKIDYIPR